MNFIRILMLSGRAKDAYIGISREANTDEFKNADDTQLDFLNWRTPKRNLQPRKECAYVSSQNNFKWLLNLCNAPLRYVCKIVPDSLQLTPKRYRCYVCDNALSNEDCNRNGMQECQINQLSCQNEVRVQNGIRRISKRCKQPRACENNYIQNPRAAWYPSQCSPSFRANSVCRCCCQGDLCNAGELPCLEDSSCEALTVPQNALISCTNEYRAGSQCTFRCEEGYQLVGGASRRCNGVLRNWTGSSPTCKKITCPVQRSTLGNGEMNCTDGNNYASTCKFECNENFSLRGRRAMTCLRNGRWSAPAPVCQLIRCPDIRELPNGLINGSASPVIGAFKSFDCEEGYFLRGADTLLCVDRNLDGNGEWDNPAPKCELIVCPEASAPSNGSMLLSSEPVYDSVLSYSCDEGHFLVGNDVSRCTDINNDGIGEWDYPVPRCREILCPDIAAPKEGRFTNQKQRQYGAEVNVACDEGYYLVGDTTVTCHDQDKDGFGEWDRPLPSCEVLMCPILEAPSNGNVQLPNKLTWGSSTSFNCEVGYVLRGLPTLSCVTSNTYGIGEWDGPPPVCELIQCPSLAPPANGRFTQKLSTFYDSTVEIVCDEGFFLVGESRITCGDTNKDGVGEWSDELPQCLQIVCAEQPNAPLNGHIFTSSSESVYGTIAIFSCDEGYFMIGSSETVCGDSDDDGSGDWLGATPTCQRITCPRLTTPPNGVFTATDNFNYDSLVVVDCDEGYFLNGRRSLVCEDFDGDGNGNWNGTIAICDRIICPTVAPPTNGEIIGAPNFEYGSELSFTCDEGYFLTGNQTTLCQDSNGDGEGDWSSAVPICQEITCPSPKALNNGEVNLLSNTYGSKALFSCNGGHFLIGSHELICVDSNSDGRGEWDRTEPTCRQIVCETIDAPDNGLFASKLDLRWGSVVRFACEQGYYLNGVVSITCMDEANDGNGEWTGTVPTCQLITCSPVDNAVDGFFQISDETLRLGTEVTIKCNEGYYDFGGKVSVCSGDNSGSVGEWEGDFPECDAIVCQDRLPSPDGGEVFCTEDNFYGSLCLFSCFVGYHLQGSSSIDCVDSDSNGLGEWTDQAPTCEQIFCFPELESPRNGSVSCSSSNQFDSDCHFTCDVGYFLSGQDLVRCLDDDQDGVGTWSDASPVCKQVTCEQRNSPEHGNVSCSDGPSYGSQCTFTCDVGFSLIGFDSVQCGEPVSGPTGRWNSEAEPNCQINVCEKPSANPTNGTVECSSSNEYSSVCDYTCVQGYRMIGSSSRRCMANKQWSNEEPTCEIIRCKPTPTNPDDGLVFCTEEDKFGSICSYFCDLGFQLVGDSRSTCYGDTDNNGFGEFDTQPGYCEAITCPDIEGVRQDGTVICGIGSGNDEPNSYGSECALICFDGFRVQGPSRAICLGKGEWTQNLGVCERYKCFPPLFAPGGVTKTCSNANDELGTVCRFQCLPGFTLQGPQEVTCLDSGEWASAAPTCVR
uniref:Sushi, von Willebrand factor type A, EGF and pentraxin domain-containing protein 1-like n=1 Tax=Phallusia mammillata TaxID=59560 RepID=A0A6F9DTG3_9ASCI|nr:sushi, von Willebrand factor type A, EGF and pentraxin domain-containing protein 1-like [Phallusia mammillata]